MGEFRDIKHINGHSATYVFHLITDYKILQVSTFMLRIDTQSPTNAACFCQPGFCLIVLLCVSEWLSLTVGWSTADIGVYVVHRSRVIITYTLEPLSSFTQITRNLQVTINLRKMIEKQTQKWGHPLSRIFIGDSNSTSVYNNFKWLN